jgi:hypothetical protein
MRISLQAKLLNFIKILLLLAYCQSVSADVSPASAGRQPDSNVSEKADKAAAAQPTGLPASKTTPSQASQQQTSQPSSPQAQTSRTAQQSAQQREAEAKRTVMFQSLAQMDELIELGVPSLALSLLDSEQKGYQQFSPDWYGFVYKRILLMAELDQWQELLERSDWLLSTAIDGYQIVPKIRIWFETQQVIARLQLRNTETALAQLQKLIWRSKPEDRNAELFRLWRQLVIRIYLQQDEAESARRAMLKYQHDYADESSQQAVSTDWLILQARVQLNTGHPGRAIDILQQIEIQDALDVETLKWIAELQHRPAIAAEVNQQMRERLDGQVLSRYQRWAYSYVAYMASGIIGDVSSRISNLESMLTVKLRIPLFDDDYQVSADDLWDLYDGYGTRLANDNGLLFGSEQQWTKRAESLRAKHPEQALALNVAWVLHGQNFSDEKQHQAIVEILEARPDGLELINQLYLHSERVDDIDKLPDAVRYRLVDHALGEGDYEAAVALMKTLAEPPDGASLFDWRMRTARVMVLKGEYSESEQLIRKTFAEKKSITHAELDRYIQVVFDFQTVQQHEIALRLFALISMKGLEDNLRRELYFWEAESYMALKQYDRAALNYLESAYALKDGANDLWAQSARFKAGTALQEGAIYDDAEKVFNDLLVITASESRRALIKQNLQKIKLQKSVVSDSS